MDKTKNDLCSGEMKIDYDALLCTVGVSVRLLLDDVYQGVTQIRNDLDCKNIRPMLYIVAHTVETNAAALTRALETYYTLYHGRDRESKIFVNIPPAVEKVKNE